MTNIGSVFEISIEETDKTIAFLMDEDVQFIQDIERVRPDKSEVERLFASYDKAKLMMNWTPNYAGIDGFKKGLKTTIDWFSIEDNLKRYKTDIYNI